MKRIGLLTSGGDCQALYATMRGIVKGLASNLDELEVYGFENGYKGLIYGDYRLLTARDFSGILTRGGTILGTSRVPFKTVQTELIIILLHSRNLIKPFLIGLTDCLKGHPGSPEDLSLIHI